MSDVPDLDGLFRPRSIAVIGASRRNGTIGRELLRNIIGYEFEGKVFPVNPGADVIHSMKCHASVLSIPDAVDMAVIIVPRDEVLRVVDDCGRKGVKGVVVISAGFREVGEAGAERERKLVEIVRSYGMRMVGPNCMGILNTCPSVSLDATFAPTHPLRGGIGFLSQSGAMGVAILNRARALGLGFSMFASMGNKADVSGNDLLAYLANDDATKLILMYLESFGNPRNFTRLARRITRAKPVLCVKSGRTVAGAAAAASHTGAIAGRDAAVDALLAQCGVLRADSVETLFAMALAFSSQPLPRGRRVAILTDAGGPGIMATDALVEAGMELAALTDETRATLAASLSPEASVANPVDMLGHSGVKDYEYCLGVLLADPTVDAVITLYVPPVMHDPVDVARAIREVMEAGDKPVLCVFMAQDEVLREVQRRHGSAMPVYEFPEQAVRALAAMVHYAELRDRQYRPAPRFDVDADAVKTILATAAAEERDMLTLEESRGVLEAYGVPFAQSRLVRDAGEMEAAVAAVGLPAVIKLSSPDLVHKTDVGGVVTDLRTAEEVSEAYEAMLARVNEAHPEATIEGVVVQRMVTGAREMILGMSSDPVFGPLLMAGFGGTEVEVMRDVSFRVHPINEQDAREMVARLRGAPLLEGFRGARPVCVEAYHEALMRIDQLVGDHLAIQELDVNPFLMTPDAADCCAVDARVRIDPKLC